MIIVRISCLPSAANPPLPSRGGLRYRYVTVTRGPRYGYVTVTPHPVTVTHGHRQGARRPHARQTPRRRPLPLLRPAPPLERTSTPALRPQTPENSPQTAP